MPISAIGLNSKINVSEVVIPFSSFRNCTLNFSPLHRCRFRNGVVQAAHGMRLRMESLAIHSNFPSLTIRRPTARESLGHVVHSKLKAFMVIVTSIESDLQVHLVTSAPATWRRAHDRGLVNELDRHVLWRHICCSWSETAVVFTSAMRNIS